MTNTWRWWLRSHRSRLIASALTLALAPVVAPASAAAAPTEPAFVPEREPSVPGTTATYSPPPPDPAEAAALREPPTVRWPAPGTLVLNSSPGAVNAGAPSDVPVAVTARSGRADAEVSRVRVNIADRAQAARAGVNGLLLRIGHADGGKVSAPVELAVDYRAFRYAYGGDYGARLRVYAIPECALSTPAVPACAGRPVPTRNNGGGWLYADVTAPALLPQTGPGRAEPELTGGALYAVTSGPSGSTGDFGATTLQPSSTWGAGNSSGDFTWSYPMRTPPAPAGPGPTLALSYSSASVDGRNDATNNQPSWVGEGFEFAPAGFIERRYKVCATDTEGAGNPKTADHCWGTDNATFSFNGQGGELVLDDATKVWRPKHETGIRVERLTGAANGDNDGEHWRITTTDGTQYYFGLNRLPGWSPGAPETNSTQVVPVYGNHSGEPCHKSTFAESWCMQAYRWNLDYSVDVHGNVTTYHYVKETNKYGRNLGASTTAYDRGALLARIEYGQRADSIYSTPAPARVVFETADRCLPGSTCTLSRPADWPDTPLDQLCTTSTCSQYAPTFFTTKRLAKVVTQVRDGTGYRDVDSWSLTQTYPDPGDGTRAGLWLEAITHTGHVGGTMAMPQVSFDGIQLNNRVDSVDGRPAMNWWRVSAIHSESGGELAITYSGHDCTPTSLPSSPATNDRRCMPTKINGEGEPDKYDWYHKYVVTQVTETDRTTGLQPVVEYYEYVGTPAWRYADDDGLVPPEKKTWSQWRGYSKVRTISGHPSDGPQSVTETLYFRGMDEDRTASGGKKDVKVVDSQGGVWEDSDRYAGFVRERVKYNGVGGPVVSRTISDPWVSPPTATRVRSWGTTTATYLGTAVVRSFRPLSGGGLLETRTETTFDNRGNPVQVNDLGNVAKSDDDSCTRYTYVDNISAWLIALNIRTESVAVNCSATPSLPDDLLTDTKIYYDGSDTWGAVPTKGNATRVDEVSGYSAGVPTYVTTARTTYDPLGRELETFDALGRRHATSYTPAIGGPVTAVTETDPMGNTSTTLLEPAWGMSVAQIDVNGKRIDLEYDPLGRLTKVWNVSRDKATETPSTEYSYLIRQNGPTVVTSKLLLPNGTYRTMYELYDGLLRPRQTQVPAPGGGRSVTDTVYNSRGLVVKENGPYYNDAPAGFDVLLPDEAQLPAQNVTVYDGAERTVAEIFKVQGTEKWRTTITHDGDRVHVDPPAGDTPTTTIVDEKGQTVELRQYHGASPTGTYDATRYTYTRSGQLATVTDPAGNVWRYTYDVRGRQIRSVDPDRGTTEYTYDDEDQLLAVTDARGKTIAYTYDALGRRTTMREGSATGPKLAEWTYDTLVKGKPTAAIRYVGANAYTVEVTGYDSAYQITGTRVTIPASEGALAGTYEFAASFHDDGSPATSTQPAAGGLPAETLTYGYDEFGMPSTLVGATTYVTNTTYTPYGELSQLELDAGGKYLRRSFEYEIGTRRVGRMVTERETSPMRISELRYYYDAAGNVTKVTDTPSSLSGQPTDTQCFTYDYLRRLLQAWTPASGNCAYAPSVAALGGPAPYWHAWTFDKVGNRLTETKYSASGNTQSTYSYPAPGSAHPHALQSVTTTGPQGTRTDTYTYDATGNVTGRTLNGAAETLTWDSEGRLSSITVGGQTTSFVYSANGERLLRRDPGGTTLYLPGMELRLTGSTVTGTRYYTHAGQQVAVRTGADGKLYWLATDVHGTPYIAVDAASQEVSVRRQTPYGSARGSVPSTWPGEKAFVGGTADPGTGLVHLGAREYDPATGRFISVDPMIDVEDPQTMHGYAYSNNSPVTFSDPDGLWPSCGWCKKAANWVSKKVSSAVSYVRSYVSSSVNYYRSWVSNKISQVKRWVSETKQKVVNAVKRKVAQAKRWVAEKKRQVTRAFDTAKRKVGNFIEEKKRQAAALARRAAEVAAKVGRAVADAAKAAWEWTKEHRGMVVSILATAGCLVPAVGFAACAALQAIALGVRMQQRAEEGGGWSKTWKANLGDAALTVLPLGMIRAPLHFVKHGTLGWLNPKRYPSLGNPGKMSRVTPFWQETFGESLLKIHKLSPGQLGRSLTLTVSTFVPSYGMATRLAGDG